MGRRILLAAAFACLLAAQALAAGLETKSVKLSLDWAFQGPESIFLYGSDKGEFSKRGLDAQLDRGTGTGDTLVRVASGAYDFGWADIGPKIKFKAEDPGQLVVV